MKENKERENRDKEKFARREKDCSGCGNTGEGQGLECLG